MIDRQARDQMALLLRRLVAGRITNDDFESDLPHSDDPVIRAVHGVAWAMYSDNYTHRLVGKHKLSPQMRREVARWVLFLHTDLEYPWPRFRFFVIYNWPFNLLTLGWWERRKRRKLDEFKRAGDFEVWPFLRRTHFETAVSKPRYLTGRSRAA